MYEPFTHGSGGLVHVDQDMDGNLLLFETSLESGVLHAELTFVDQDDEYVAMDGLTLEFHSQAGLAPPGPAQIHAPDDQHNRVQPAAR